MVRLLPGDPARSLLIAAVRHDGELQMPRGGDRLTDTQVAAMETWIRNGLPWPRNTRVLTRAKLFTISDADRNHWAFLQLAKNSRSWSIDSALKRHHQSAAFTPAPRADRHRLLRRRTYDLIGNPPTVAEIENFLVDESPDPWLNVVNRLLDDELFGSRWGRNWLDYSRNGVNGKSNSGPIMDPDRYASWVAKCLNEDRPYDWFGRVHLAGDRMPAPNGAEYSIDQAIAAATRLNGPRTFDRAETATFVLMDKLDEGVEFLGRSLLGLSLECARCHVRFIQVYSGGAHNDDIWDAHGDLEKNHKHHAGATDKPIAGLLQDLKDRGLLDETLVIWGGEFGRQPTAEYTKGSGRDHNSYGFTMWMAGGGIKGGVSVGATDEIGSAAVDQPLHVKNLHATVLHQLGLDPNNLSYFYSALNQKLVGVEHVKPVEECIA